MKNLIAALTLLIASISFAQAASFRTTIMTNDSNTALQLIAGLEERGLDYNFKNVITKSLREMTVITIRSRDVSPEVCDKASEATYQAGLKHMESNEQILYLVGNCK